MFPLKTILVYLILLGANERSFVNVGVGFNVRIVAELESVLDMPDSELYHKAARKDSTYPFTIVEYHGFRL